MKRLDCRFGGRKIPLRYKPPLAAMNCTPGRSTAADAVRSIDSVDWRFLWWSGSSNSRRAALTTPSRLKYSVTGVDFGRADAPVGHLATDELSVMRNGVVAVRGNADQTVGEFGWRLVVLAGHSAKIGQYTSRGTRALMSSMSTGSPMPPRDRVEVPLGGFAVTTYRCGED